MVEGRIVDDPASGIIVKKEQFCGQRRIAPMKSKLYFYEFSATELVDLAFVLTKMNSKEYQDVLGHRLDTIFQAFQSLAPLFNKIMPSLTPVEAPRLEV
uniref:DNA-directed DNA polymerase n=1 Tax=Heterorhabditis bacteriophora TaxID=37862 RepID=A0A1I7XAB9_HETBA